VKLLPKSRRGRLALAGGLLAALALAVWCDWYRPWEARYLGRPSAWWAEEVRSARARPPRAWWSPRAVSDWVGARLLGQPAPAPSQLAWGGAAAVPVLAELLRHEDYRVRRLACIGLGNKAAEAPEARRYLEQALGDADPLVRLVAHGCLGRSLDTAVPWLVELLALPDPEDRELGATHLALMGAKAREAVPALLPLTRDPEARVAEEARRAVYAIDPDALWAYDRGHPGAGPGGGE
jgi:HEAT repeat protein